MILIFRKTLTCNCRKNKINLQLIMKNCLVNYNDLLDDLNPLSIFLNYIDNNKSTFIINSKILRSFVSVFQSQLLLI